MLLSFCIFFSLLFFFGSLFFWLIAWLIARVRHSRVRYAPFGWTALACSVMFVAAMLYGYWFGRYQIQVVPTTYQSARVPSSLDGYKIVHISDLHLSSFVDNPSALQRVIDSINAQKPDLICFTGDFVSFGIEEAMPLTPLLTQLRAADGVMSVLGNHDFALYRHQISEAEQAQQIESLVAYQRDSLGWSVLRNRYATIVRDTDTMQVIGVDNASCGGQGFRTIYRADLKAAMQTPLDSASVVHHPSFSFLLSHDPTHWRAEVLPDTNIPLTLSGHTHAGQVRVLGYSISSWLFNESQGWYHEDDQSLYINTGIGCTLPVRIGVPAEITVITLKSK